MSDSLPLPNDPAARTPDGTIKDATTLTPQPTPSTPTDPNPNDPGQTNPAPDPAKPATTAPESYTFKAPEGRELDQTLVDAATPVFRELGLTQAQADKLVDFWNTQAQTQADLTKNAIAEMGRQWEAKTQADPELGPKLDQIKTDIGRALETKLNPTERAAFAKAMNETAVGNHPEFVRAFWKLAQSVAPGTHVPGGGPSPHGQNPTGQSARPSVAASIWPNLKAS